MKFYPIILEILPLQFGDTVSQILDPVYLTLLKFDTNFLALFIPRQKIASEEDTQLLAEEWAEDLESMKCFVLEGKKFVHLPEEEKGQFYSANCYVFVCRYLYAPELDDDEELDDDDDVEDEAQFKIILRTFGQEFLVKKNRKLGQEIRPKNLVRNRIVDDFF